MIRLVSTNPKPNGVASETLGLRHPVFSTGDSLLMSAFSLLKTPQLLTLLLRCFKDAPLPLCLAAKFPSSVDSLDPIILGAKSPPRRSEAILVSCYALFKGWLLLSQPPNCVGNVTTFTLKSHLGTLDENLGCFPLAETGLSRLD